MTFKYPSRELYVYRNLSLKVERGKKVALVGPSGCGKSTVIQLVLGFYELEAGEILVNGRNIKDYKRKELRSMFGLVSQ